MRRAINVDPRWIWKQVLHDRIGVDAQNWMAAAGFLGSHESIGLYFEQSTMIVTSGCALKVTGGL
jgi:hypothetical protein